MKQLLGLASWCMFMLVLSDIGMGSPLVQTFVIHVGPDGFSPMDEIEWAALGIQSHSYIPGPDMLDGVLTLTVKVPEQYSNKENLKTTVWDYGHEIYNHVFHLLDQANPTIAIPFDDFHWKDLSDNNLGTKNLTFGLRYLGPDYKDDDEGGSLPEAVPAPEPGSLLLLGSGLMAAALLVRRHR